MGYWEDDVYYAPEKSGLEIVKELEDETLSYEFSKLVVWKDKEGSFYWATDSGCSCPSPFEDYVKVEDLTKLTLDEESFAEFEKAALSVRWSEDEDADAKQFVQDIRMLLKGNR